jgi:hypothetical protein
MKYLRKAQISHDSEPTQISIDYQSQKLVNKEIFMTLAENPFACIRRIASLTLIPRTTVYRHLDEPPE